MYRQYRPGTPGWVPIYPRHLTHSLGSEGPVCSSPLLARYLGYDAAMYDGSFQEWSAKNMPLVKGDSKR